MVSKKVIKSAVKRNRIRRRLYEAIRGELPNLKPQLDVVLIVISPELLTIESGEVVTTLKRSFVQADLYKDGNN